MPSSREFEIPEFTCTSGANSVTVGLIEATIDCISFGDNQPRLNAIGEPG
jgi:hypothetical protein